MSMNVSLWWFLLSILATNTSMKSWIKAVWMEEASMKVTHSWLWSSCLTTETCWRRRVTERTSECTHKGRSSRSECDGLSWWGSDGSLLPLFFFTGNQELVTPHFSNWRSPSSKHHSTSTLLPSASVCESAAGLPAHSCTSLHLHLFLKPEFTSLI